jgi:zinc/manganese transport system permease protein
MSAIDILIAPLVDFAFMRRALVACIAIALGAAPIGCFLVLRRMSLIGDAMSHAILPGAALGYLIAGLSLPALSLGGFAAGIVAAAVASLVARVTPLREDASFAVFYLVALAAGVLIISLSGSQLDLLRLLFGSILGVDDAALIVIAAVTTLTVVILAVILRALVVESFDPNFLRVAGGPSAAVHAIFMAMVVANLVASFQALGTLLAVGIMMLPAVSARFWARSIGQMMAIAVAVGIASSIIGLLLSYHLDVPTGPTVILTAGTACLVSFLFGSEGGVASGLMRRRGVEA